ncbi:Probable beta-1,3-galactosyltransferase 3 [Linum grandiflorum]
MFVQERRPWSDLFPELLCSILSNLHGKDVPVFRAVCRNWSSIAEPLTKHITDPLSEIVKHPFLLRPSTYEFYSPAYTKTYYYQPGLPGARILSSNYGWLLMSLGKTNLFFFNPSTGDSINLPPHNDSRRFRLYNLMSFSAPPTSPDCVVFGLVDAPPYCYVHYTFIRRGDRAWHSSSKRSRTGLDIERYRLVARHYISSSRKQVMVHQGNRCKFRRFPCKVKFKWSNYQSAPVFHNGAFYCLGQRGGGGRGRLGIFDPTKNMWKILDVESCRSHFSTNPRNPSFLMESSRGELISIYVGQIVPEQVAEVVGGPLIILSHDEEEGKLEACPFWNLVNGRGRMESSLCLRGNQVYGGGNGRAVVIDFKSRDCSLLNTSTMAMEPLPTWPIMPESFRKFGCLVQEWKSISTVTITGEVIESSTSSEIMKLKCRVGDEEWITPEGGPTMYEAVGYQGKIYGWGTIRVEDDEAKLLKVEEDGRAEVVETPRIERYRPTGTMKFTDYVVESLGEILWFGVFWSHWKLVNEAIMDVRAYRLDSKMRWEEVKDLGNRTFFFYPEIKEFGCCVSGSRFPKNNIYFILEEGDNIVYVSVDTIVHRGLPKRCDLMWYVHEPKSGLSRTTAVEVKKLKLISECCGSIITIDKTISSLEMEVAAAKATQASLLTGSPQSEDTKKGSTLRKKRKYLMVVGINTAFSIRKRRDSVCDTWMPQGSISALFGFSFQLRPPWIEQLEVQSPSVAASLADDFLKNR